MFNAKSNESENKRIVRYLQVTELDSSFICKTPYTSDIPLFLSLPDVRHMLRLDLLVCSAIK